MRPGVLLLILAVVAAAAALAEPFDECGWFEDWEDGCILFVTKDGSRSYLTRLTTLPDSLQYRAIARVHADWNWNTESCGEYFWGQVLENVVISECEPVDLGCGTLGCDCIEPYMPCYHWHSPANGDLLLYDLPQGYAIGDSVQVRGVIAWLGNNCGLPVLWSPQFESCEQTPPAVQWDTWGAIKILFK